MRQFRTPRPGDRAGRASDFQALAAEVARLGNFDCTGAALESDAGGQHLILPPPKPAFWARLTAEYASDPGVYTWIEQERSALGTFTDLQYGRYDDGLSPAVEANRTSGLPTDATAGVGAYVWLELGYGLAVTGGVVQEWIFRHAGGADKVRPVFVTDQAVSGRYPARIDRRDESVPAWLAVDPLQFVWAIGYNGETLTANTRYKGLLVSTNPADGQPVYAVQPVGVGGTISGHKAIALYSVTPQICPTGTRTRVKLFSIAHASPEFGIIDDGANGLAFQLTAAGASHIGFSLQWQHPSASWGQPNSSLAAVVTKDGAVNELLRQSTANVDTQSSPQGLAGSRGPYFGAVILRLYVDNYTGADVEIAGSDDSQGGVAPKLWALKLEPGYA